MKRFTADTANPGDVAQDFIDQASPDLRQLLGLNHPYPEVLDAAKAGNAEGRA